MVLPFPFDAVETFFRQLFSDIARAVAKIAGDVFQGLNSALAPLRTFIEQKISSIQSIVWNQLMSLKDQILGALAGVPGAVAGLLGGIRNAIEPLINSLRTFFQNLYADLRNILTNTILPFLANIGRDFNRGVNSVIGTISAIVTPAIQQVQNLATQSLNSLLNLPGQIWNQLTEWGTSIKSDFANFGKFLEVQGTNAFAAIAGLYTPIGNLTTGFNNLIRDVTAGFLQVQQFTANIFQPGFEFVSRLMSGLKSQFLDPITGFIEGFPSMVQNVLRPTGSITPEDARTMLFALGGPSIGAYVAVNAFGIISEGATLGQVDQISRGIIDTLGHIGVSTFAKDLFTFDYEVGVKPALTREVLRRYVPMIPGAGDLVNMVVKEAFVPELRTPAPKIFAQFMAEQGFDVFWSDTFWTAHWKPLDLQIITEMFHRKIITEEDFIRRLIILDFRPDDTEIVKQWLFRLPNRVEARIMARFGLLSDEQLNEIIRSEGVREDFVEPLRVMMQEFNLTSVFSKTETAAISGFEDGVLTESDTVKLLQQIKRPPGVIAQEIPLMRLRRQLDFKRRQIAAVTSAAKKDIITSDVAQTEYIKLGLDPDVIGLLVGIATYEKNIATPESVKKAAPKLTVQQIIKGVRVGAILPDAALATLQAKGYTAEEVRVLFEVSALELKQDLLIKAVKEEVILPDAARTELEARGLTPEDVTVLFKTEGIEAA